MLALLLAIAQTTPDPSKWTAATENGMTACRARAGWHSIFDGLAADAWKASAGTATASYGWLTVTPMQDAELAYPRALGDFELEACAVDESGFSIPLYVRVRAGAVHVVDDLTALPSTAVAVGSRCKVGPVVVERLDASETPWRLLLAVSGHRHAFSGIVLREEWTLPGSRARLLDPDLELRATPPERLKHSVEGGDLRIEASGNSRLLLGPDRDDFMLEFEVRGAHPSVWGLGLGRGRSLRFSDLEFGATYDKDGSNRIRVECVGPWIRAWVNDRLAQSLLHMPREAGPISLEFQREGSVVLHDVTLRDLGLSSWTALALLPMQSTRAGDLSWRASQETWQDFSLRAVLPSDLHDLVVVANAQGIEPRPDLLTREKGAAGFGSGPSGTVFRALPMREEESPRSRTLDLSFDGPLYDFSIDGQSQSSNFGPGTCRGGMIGYPRGRVFLISSQRDALARVQVSVLEGSTH